MMGGRFIGSMYEGEATSDAASMTWLSAACPSVDDSIRYSLGRSRLIYRTRRSTDFRKSSQMTSFDPPDVQCTCRFYVTHHRNSTVMD